jgi:hypothetical protein
MKRSWTPVERIYTSGTSDVFGVNARKSKKLGPAHAGLQ